MEAELAVAVVDAAAAAEWEGEADGSRRDEKDGREDAAPSGLRGGETDGSDRRLPFFFLHSEQRTAKRTNAVSWQGWALSELPRVLSLPLPALLLCLAHLVSFAMSLSIVDMAALCCGAMR